MTTALNVPIYGVGGKRKPRRRPPIARASQTYEILAFLAKARPMLAKDVTAGVGGHRHSVGLHLTRMRRLGYVTSEKTGTSTIYLWRITDEGRDAIVNAKSGSEIRALRKQRIAEVIADGGAVRAFHRWRERETDRLVRLGCSLEFAREFMAPWYSPIGPSIDAMSPGVTKDQD